MGADLEAGGVSPMVWALLAIVAAGVAIWFENRVAAAHAQRRREVQAERAATAALRAELAAAKDVLVPYVQGITTPEQVFDAAEPLVDRWVAEDAPQR